MGGTITPPCGFTENALPSKSKSKLFKQKTRDTYKKIKNLLNEKAKIMEKPLKVNPNHLSNL